MPPGARQIASVTALRGIAALLVVTYHFDSLMGFLQLGPVLSGSGLISRGYLWVDFFFVLSGLIITHVYGDWFTHGVPREALRAFLLARFSRLYPLYFVALLLTIVQYVGLYARMPAQGDGMSMAELYPWGALPFHLLMLISFGLTKMTWNVPGWSIGAEWWTYLLALPAYRFLNRGVSARTWILPPLCAAGLWLLMTLYPYHALNITFDFGLLRCILSFTVGICLYQVYRAGLGRRWLCQDGALLAAVALTLLTLHYPAPPPPPADMKSLPVLPPLTPVVDALSPLVFALLILCAASNEGRGRRLLNARPLVHLGDLSFSLYLLQGMAFPLVFIGGTIWKTRHPGVPLTAPALLGLLGATLLVDYLFARLSYRWVEVPARRWLRQRYGA